MKIKITEKHIENSIKLCQKPGKIISRVCPTAVALKEAFSGAKVMVGFEAIEIKTKGNSRDYYTSFPRLRKQIKSFTQDLRSFKPGVYSIKKVS